MHSTCTLTDHLAKVNLKEEKYTSMKNVTVKLVDDKAMMEELLVEDLKLRTSIKYLYSREVKQSREVRPASSEPSPSRRSERKLRRSDICEIDS